MTAKIRERIAKAEAYQAFRYLRNRGSIVEHLLKDACDRHGASRAALLGRRQMKPEVLARRDVCVQLRQRGWSLNRIGHALGGLHHTSVMHALRMAGDIPVPERIIPRKVEIPIQVPDFSGEWAI